VSALRYITVEEVERLHVLVIDRLEGSAGIRDRAPLESAVAQPMQTFGGEDLYPTLAAKAAAIAYTLVLGHPFIDGNKRIGHAAMEVFLMLNGYQVTANVDEQERLFLQLAAGNVSREELVAWIEVHLTKLS